MTTKSTDAVASRYLGARVPKSLYEQFQEVAASEDRSVSAQLRRVIQEHVEQVQEKAAA